MTRMWLAQGARAAVYIGGLGLVAAAGHVALRSSWAVPLPKCELKLSAPVKVAEVLDGGAVRLASGQRVLLSGLDVPRQKGKRGAEPFAGEAHVALKRFLDGRAVRMSEAGAPTKSGWLRAQLFLESGAWIQGDLASAGLARVRTYPDRRECAAALLAREAAARSAKAGLWANAAYAVQSPETAATVEGGFGVVEGVVQEAVNAGGRLYLNFGSDWRSDFTVHVRPERVRALATSGLDLEGLGGKRIRVRGYVTNRNGPQIDVTTPEQIEVLK